MTDKTNLTKLVNLDNEIKTTISGLQINPTKEDVSKAFGLLNDSNEILSKLPEGYSKQVFVEKNNKHKNFIGNIIDTNPKLGFIIGLLILTISIYYIL